MHSCIINHLLTCCSEGLNYLVLHLPSRPYSGFFSKADSCPIFFLVSIMVGLCPLGLYCFTRCIPNTLDFRRKYWGICSIIEGLPFCILNISNFFGISEVVFVWRFPEEAMKLPEFFFKLLPGEMDYLSCSISLGLSALIASILAILPLVWRSFFRALGCPNVPDYLGIFPKLSEWLLHDCKWSPRKYALYLIFSLSRDEEVFSRMIPFSPTGFWCIYISSCLMRRRG